MRFGFPSFYLAVAAVSASACVPPPTPDSGTIQPAKGSVYLGANDDPALGTPEVAIAALESVLGRTLALHPSSWSLVNGSTFNNHKDLSQIAANPEIQDDVTQGRTPTFVRPVWEFNSNINNPKTNSNGNDCFSAANVDNVPAQAAEFIAYFKHLVDVFKQQGVTNVTWIWCPSVRATLLAEYDVTPFYPGDAYVDWIGGDAFDDTDAPTRGFVGIFSSYWTTLKGMGKPMMIAATGEQNNATDGFTQQKFFTDATAALSVGGAFYESESVRISAMTYFDANGSASDWSVDSPVDTAGEAAWKAMATTASFTAMP